MCTAPQTPCAPTSPGSRRSRRTFRRTQTTDHGETRGEQRLDAARQRGVGDGATQLGNAAGANMVRAKGQRRWCRRRPDASRSPRARLGSLHRAQGSARRRASTANALPVREPSAQDVHPRDRGRVDRQKLRPRDSEILFWQRGDDRSGANRSAPIPQGGSTQSDMRARKGRRVARVTHHVPQALRFGLPFQLHKNRRPHPLVAMCVCVCVRGGG